MSARGGVREWLRALREDGWELIFDFTLLSGALAVGGWLGAWAYYLTR